jgi:hypothetical protein
MSNLTRNLLLSKKGLFLSAIKANERVVFSTSTLNEAKDVAKSSDSSQSPVPQPDAGKKVSPYRYSPFQVTSGNKVDYALARVDDILNNIRKVNNFFKLSFPLLLFIQRAHFGRLLSVWPAVPSK